MPSYESLYSLKMNDCEFINLDFVTTCLRKIILKIFWEDTKLVICSFGKYFLTIYSIGYPLQHFRASFVAQMVKNPPSMWETWVGYLGWQDPLEKGKATHSSILAWRIPRTARGVMESRIWLSDFHFQHCVLGSEEGAPSIELVY